MAQSWGKIAEGWVGARLQAKSCSLSIVPPSSLPFSREPPTWRSSEPQTLAQTWSSLSWSHNCSSLVNDRLCNLIPHTHMHIHTHTTQPPKTLSGFSGESSCISLYLHIVPRPKLPAASYSYITVHGKIISIEGLSPHTPRHPSTILMGNFLTYRRALSDNSPFYTEIPLYLFILALLVYTELKKVGILTRQRGISRQHVCVWDQRREPTVQKRLWKWP